MARDTGAIRAEHMYDMATYGQVDSRTLGRFSVPIRRLSPDGASSNGSTLGIGFGLSPTCPTVGAGLRWIARLGIRPGHGNRDGRVASMSRDRPRTKRITQCLFVE